MIYTPREYQLNDFERIRAEYRAGADSVLHVSPTGSGKTIVECMIAMAARKKNNPVLILTHRDNILRQFIKKLQEFGLQFGVIAAGYPTIRYKIQVASVQTLHRRLQQWSPDDFKLIIIDEAHHALAKTWLDIKNYFSKPKTFGATATAIRDGGYGLGDVFDSMVIGPSYDYLISKGFLSKPKYYIPEHIDLSDVKITAGDFNKKQLAQKMDRSTIIGNAVEFYGKYCDKEPAMAFCTSIKNAEHVAEQFTKAGYISKPIHSKLSYEENTQILQDFTDGKVHVVTSCEKVSEGFDIRALKAVLLLRPTQSLGLNHQQNGRASRVYPGKEYSIHIDCASNCERHGLIHWPIKWELTTGKYSPQIAGVKICQYCFAAYPANMKKCPECGLQNISRGSRGEPLQVAGNLKEIDYKGRNRLYEEAKTLSDFVKISVMYGYKEGHGYHMWEQKQRKKEATK